MDKLRVVLQTKGEFRLKIINGRDLFIVPFNTDENSLDLESLCNGLYFL
ncbi:MULTISPECIES: hypothetical protein [Bizionia]|nr:MULTISPECIES: hypothetical protein [Bizionia]